jgi:hypothetical protein
MTQYDERVEKQRLKIEAEIWSKGVKSAHAHSLNSMWYDTRPQDTENGRGVLDIQYNDETVKRTLDNGEIYIFGTPLKGQALIDSYIRST